MYLNAANATARIDYVRVAAAEIIPVVGTLAQSGPVAFVTLAEKRFTVGLKRAAGFDVGPLQAWVRRRLPDCSFIGTVEAALYGNAGIITERMDRLVSWHVHLLVWGISARRLAALIRKVNRRYETFVPGLRVGDAKPLDAAGVAATCYYLHKGVVSSYRIWASKREVTDPETGEITREPTGRFEQAADAIRPGDHARMVHILADHTIDRLAFAARDGVALLARINRKALARFTRSERERLARTQPPRIARPPQPHPSRVKLGPAKPPRRPAPAQKARTSPAARPVSPAPRSRAVTSPRIAKPATRTPARPGDNPQGRKTAR